jgi:hypothetical protein
MFSERQRPGPVNDGKTCQQGYFREELLEPQFLDLVRGRPKRPGFRRS